MIYLDNAATTFPKPSNVYEETYRFMKEGAGNPGRGYHYFANTSGQVVENTRRQVARFFQIPDHRRVVFTLNCTDSINIVLKGYLRSGDHVVATNLDHNATSRPLESLIKSRGIEVTRVPFDENHRVDPNEVRKAVRNNTRLVTLTHGSNVLGVVQNLVEFIRIVQDHGIALLVDAAQTAGRVPLDLSDSPAFLACTGHKGLYGFPGVGILTLPPNAKLERWREGGTGTTSESLHHPEELPMRLEAGTPNFLGIASIQEGLRFIESEGMQKIHGREMILARRLYEFLLSDRRFVVYSRTDSEQSLSIVSFNVRNVPTEEVAAILDHNFGIAVRGGLHCAAVLHAQLGTSPGGCIRVSPGYFNQPEEIDTLIHALTTIAGEYSSAR